MTYKIDQKIVGYKERVARAIGITNEYITNWDNENDAVRHFIGGMKYAITLIENRPDIWGIEDAQN